MRRALLIGASVGLGFGLASLAVRLYPAASVRAHLAGIDAQAGGTLRVLHAPLPDASFDRIVKPSPDLLYSTFTFDLDEGPVSVRLPKYDGTWVAQVMDASGNSVGYLRAGDERAAIALEGQRVPGEPRRVVRVAHPRGAVLVRYLVEAPSEVTRLDEVRRRIEVARAR